MPRASSCAHQHRHAQRRIDGACARDGPGAPPAPRPHHSVGSATEREGDGERERHAARCYYSGRYFFVVAPDGGGGGLYLRSVFGVAVRHVPGPRRRCTTFRSWARSFRLGRFSLRRLGVVLALRPTAQPPHRRRAGAGAEPEPGPPRPRASPARLLLVASTDQRHQRQPKHLRIIARGTTFRRGRQHARFARCLVRPRRRLHPRLQRQPAPTIRRWRPRRCRRPSCRKRGCADCHTPDDVKSAALAVAACRSSAPSPSRPTSRPIARPASAAGRYHHIRAIRLRIDDQRTSLPGYAALTPWATSRRAHRRLPTQPCARVAPGPESMAPPVKPTPPPDMRCRRSGPVAPASARTAKKKRRGEAIVSSVDASPLCRWLRPGGVFFFAVRAEAGRYRSTALGMSAAASV